MVTIPDPAWAFLAIVVVVAMRDVAMAYIASRATGAPRQKREPKSKRLDGTGQ